MLTPQNSVRKNLVLAGSGRPRTACSHCKSHKVRCSGDRPTCRRCSRLNHTCIYGTSSPQVPKLSPVRSRTPEKGFRTPTGIAETSSNQASQAHHAPEVILSDKDYLGVPLSLVPALIEVFYSYGYNASLLLHRELFLRRLAEGTVTSHVLLSVCAIASNFYRDDKGNASLRDHGFGTEWAERASKLVFQDVENPTEDNLVTFLNLTLFWYSHGSWRRAYIHNGNAVQTAHILGLGNEKRRTENSLQSEIGRRRYWACYLINCHASEFALVREPSESTLNLPLPWSEKDFNAGCSTHDMISLDSEKSNNGVYCEMIKAMTFWSEVYGLINSPESSTKARVSAIHSLDNQISEWWSKIDPSLRLPPENAPNTDAGILPKLLLIHVVYHQCLCALHSSIVPLFSWSAGDDGWVSARQLSAQIAYDHACAVSTLLESALVQLPDASAIPSFVAYAAYCGCATQIPFLWSSEPRVQERAQTNVRTNVKIIHILAKHWKFSALLEVHVQYLYQKHAQNPIVLENEPKFLDPGKLNAPRITARHARASILGHTKILWASGTGYARQGEEVKDLGSGAEEDMPRPVDAPNANIAPTPVQYPRAPPYEVPVDPPDESMLDLFPHEAEYLDMTLFDLEFFNAWSGGDGTGGPAGILENMGFSM